ncbi:MAG: LysE family transporter [Crocinitomicaceae bacterium]|jgi:threonine/homoserine/homoserine lactone efflux protein|nr:LysE family transporter [Crocinitomicaceae bacterium]MBP6033660.1 LysE family transporter [Crocinitomicaceae bacterium]
MDFFIQAFSIGFLLSVMVGPIFFLLLETSITKGFRSALALDFGVLVSDIVYVLIAVMFVEQIKGLIAGNKLMFSMIGGAIFVIYGMISLFKKVALLDSQKLEGIDASPENSRQQNNTKDYVFLGLKGFVLNFANPMVIFYWVSVASVANNAVPDENSTTWAFVFLGVVLLTFFSVDVLKIIAAKKIRPLVNQTLLNGLNRLIGIVFTLFGIFLILQFFLKK